jgi:hypothetical protein
MRQGHRVDADREAQREAKLDRSAEKEPSAHRRRRLPARGYLRNARLADIAAGLYDGLDENTAGVLQPPVKVGAQ